MRASRLAEHSTGPGCSQSSLASRCRYRVSDELDRSATDADPARPARSAPRTRALKPLQAPRAHINPAGGSAPVVRCESSKNFRSCGSSHRTLRFVDLQPKLRRHEATHAGHDPFACTLTANVDVAVVSVAAESMASTCQLLVKLVQHQVAQQRRQRSALRRSLGDRTHQPHSPSPQPLGRHG